MILALSLFVAACGPSGGDTAPEAPEEAEDSVCATDSDCSDTEICDDDACVDGDRNDEIEGAELLLWDSPEDGEINPEGDVDWYAVQAEGGEFVRIDVVTAEEDGGLDSVVSVYTEGGKRLVWEDEHPAGDVSTADSMVFAYFADAATYYIKVEDRGTFYDDTLVGGPREDYTLQITEWNTRSVEPDSAQEAGVTFADASENVLYSFPVLLEEPGDIDWAAIELPAVGSPISFAGLVNDEESDLVARVTLRNQDGDEVLSRVDPTGEDVAMLPNPEGTRYVLGVGDDAGGGGETYWTWVFFAIREAGSGNTPGEEPDDLLENAGVVTLDDQEPDSGRWYAAYRQGRIGTADDVDLYRFDVPFDDAYVTTVLGAQSYGSLLVPRVELLDGTGAVLDLVESTPGTDVDAMNLGPVATGTYYLRLSGAESDGGEGHFYLFGLHVTSFELD